LKSDARDPVQRYPITSIADCCTREASGHPAAALLSRLDELPPPHAIPDGSTNEGTRHMPSFEAFGRYIEAANPMLF
jgi:hypothetical protein